MQQAGEYRIAAPRDIVWQALNDPGVLARCIPGCEAFEETADSNYEARVMARIGPVSASFQVHLAITDAHAPQRYTLSGTVKSGTVGFGKGSADVQLENVAEGTHLRYRLNAHVGGKLAQLGSRLIDGVLRKTGNDFFSRFNEILSAHDRTAAAAVHGDEVGDVSQAAQDSKRQE
jgi:uncharacterized protein